MEKTAAQTSQKRKSDVTRSLRTTPKERQTATDAKPGKKLELPREVQSSWDPAALYF
jgi:hypothetical protein